VLFQSSPGDVLPPARVGEHFEVVQVLAVERAAFDDDVRETIEQILFDEWLAERRSAARVCWHWGNPERAQSAA
jgi:parvulin-like peptidyl-prolyl isomerase